MLRFLMLLLLYAVIKIYICIEILTSARKIRMTIMWLPVLSLLTHVFYTFTLPLCLYRELLLIVQDLCKLQRVVTLPYEIQ